AWLVPPGAHPTIGGGGLQSFWRDFSRWRSSPDAPPRTSRPWATRASPSGPNRTSASCGAMPRRRRRSSPSSARPTTIRSWKTISPRWRPSSFPRKRRKRDPPPPPRIAVSRDPTPTALAMPNGKIYIHTGLLSRVENESQLAMILGHEMTHVTNRHALMFNRDAQNKQIWFSALAIAASLGVAVATGNQQSKGNYVSAEGLRTTSNLFLGLGLQLAFIASVNGFGRDLEREADREGMDRMVKAGYDPREAPRVFALLKDDHGDGSKLENFFFGNHPRLDERITNTEELLK